MRGWLMFAALAGLSAVGMGAFAAHGLKARLSPESLAVIQTGVQYQLWHALALLWVCQRQLTHPGRSLRVAAACFVGGILCFSGSLYLLILAHWPMGIITPLGGLLLMVGWGALLYHGYCAREAR
ncbi:DUF423 domain-containing protein [Pseudaeromonas sp. ZJS20]|uniref:DUF423 domain-containing protein n=1 Tax=Pseudaeromonas aegiceratis TaxID=3153928 RepID=UPI00390C62BA